MLQDQQSDFFDDLARYIQEGGEISPEISVLQKKVRPLLQTLQEASDTPLWTPLNPEDFRLEFQNPLSVMGWLHLTNFALLEVQSRMEREEWDEALLLLNAFEPFNQYLRKNGNVILPSLALASRNLLTSRRLMLARKLHVNLLENELNQQLRFIRNLPPPEVQMKGDFIEKRNWVSEIFDRLIEDETGEKARDELIAKIRAHPRGGEWAGQRNLETVLTLQHLRPRVLEELTKFQTLLLREESADRPPQKDWSERVNHLMEEIIPDHRKLEPYDLNYVDQLDKDLMDALEAGRDPDSVLNAFERRFHHTVLMLVIPSDFSRLRDQMAFERLLAVHLAGELFYRKTGAFPDRLEVLSEENLLPREILTDPHTGEPFLLNQQNGKWRPYSSGENRTDNGGHDFRKDLFHFSQPQPSE